MVPGHDGPEASQPWRKPDIFCRAWQEERPQAELPVRRLLWQALHQIDEAELSVQRHPRPTIPDGEAVNEAQLSVQHNPIGEAGFQLDAQTELTLWKLQQEVDQAKRFVRASSATGRWADGPFLGWEEELLPRLWSRGHKVLIFMISLKLPFPKCHHFTFLF